MPLIKTQSNIFGERSSLCNICWECLNLMKKEEEDFITYASVVNREYEKFKLEELSSDKFKCLILCKG